MAIRRCPQCGLINPGETVTCDCGWSFVDQKMGAARELPGRPAAEAEDHHGMSGGGQIALGALLLLLGIFASIASYGAVSESGGKYAIYIGLPITGIYYIIRGALRMSNARR